MNNISAKISQKTKISTKQIETVLQLLSEGATIPFIARYRKERTNGLDEVQLTQIRDLSNQFNALTQRKEAILKSIEEQGKLTPELKKKITVAETMAILEDLYLPYKPKRRTRATIAREKGLEGLADFIFNQRNGNLYTIAEKYVDPKKEVPNIEDALAGARDIIAEWISEDAKTREWLRNLFEQKAVLKAKVVGTKKDKPEAATFRDYFDWEEAIKKIPSHRFLAILRGNAEGFLRISIRPDQEEAIHILDKLHLRNNNECTDEVAKAIEDAYKRLLQPSLETEIKNLTKEKADKEAIRVFAENMQDILLAAPLGEKRILAIDPGFRTGCKVVCLDEFGTFLEYATIFPHTGKSQEAEQSILRLVKKHKIEAIGVGNGTAGKETRNFINDIPALKDLSTVLVNESGASIYSASAVARKEFPDLDLTIRGAISIGRRLQDPLAELVKVDPKSIGVGQYQHDVQQDLLKQSLDDTVVSIVNKVGVDVNTASLQLLAYVSGLGESKASNIVQHRHENGPFKKKNELKKVKGIGPKAFEQSAGFIRISKAKNPLDGSAVHPESFSLVKEMASDLNCKIVDLVEQAELRKQVNLQKYVSDSIGLFTLNDILKELEKPGRDPRGNFEQVAFRSDLNALEDLQSGMVLNGVVTNVTKFGAFVDIGVHQDGLVHISQLANKFVKDPMEVVRVNQKVQVKVMDIDLQRKRVNLSMKEV